MAELAEKALGVALGALVVGYSLWRLLSAQFGRARQPHPRQQQRLDQEFSQPLLDAGLCTPEPAHVPQPPVDAPADGDHPPGGAAAPSQLHNYPGDSARLVTCEANCSDAADQAAYAPAASQPPGNEDGEQLPAAPAAPLNLLDVQPNAMPDDAYDWQLTATVKQPTLSRRCSIIGGGPAGEGGEAQPSDEPVGGVASEACGLSKGAGGAADTAAMQRQLSGRANAGSEVCDRAAAGVQAGGPSAVCVPPLPSIAVAVGPQDPAGGSARSPFAKRGALCIRLSSNRSIASSSSGDDSFEPVASPKPDHLERASTAPGQDDGIPRVPLPSSYSLAESLPSGSGSGLQAIGGSALANLFGESKEQNYLSIDQDGSDSDSGDSSSSADDSPQRRHGAGSSLPGAGVAGGSGRLSAGFCSKERHRSGSSMSDDFVPRPPSGAMTRESSGLLGSDSADLGLLSAAVSGFSDGSGEPPRPPAGAEGSSAGSGGAQGEGLLDGGLADGTGSAGHSLQGAAPGASNPQDAAGPQQQAAGGGARVRFQQRSATGKRSRESLELPSLALKLSVTSGPCQATTYTSDDVTTEVTVGRLDGNTLVLRDQEVSGQHLLITWDFAEKCWQVADSGSLNGTLLNGFSISNMQRKAGTNYRLRNNDILQLGSSTQIKVGYVARELLPTDLPAQHVHVPQLIVRTRQPTGPSQPKSAHSSGETFGCAQLSLEGAVAQRTGFEHIRRRQGCEDVWSVECPFDSGGQSALLCLFDGHCGRQAADAAQQLLPRTLAQEVGQHAGKLAAGEGLGAVWETVFLRTDDAIRSDEGCTATALLVWRDARNNLCLQAANVGDSAALWFSMDPAVPPLQLTADHRLTNPAERQRLTDMGIQLGKRSTRLYGLNLARCMGDRFLKDEDLGLSAQPHVSEVVRLPPGGAGMVVMASDGLWDVAEPPRVQAVALAAHENSFGSMRAVTNAICNHAQRQRTKDDVTVYAVRLNNDVATAAAAAAAAAASSGPALAARASSRALGNGGQAPPVHINGSTGSDTSGGDGAAGGAASTAGLDRSHSAAELERSSSCVRENSSLAAAGANGSAADSNVRRQHAPPAEAGDAAAD